MRRVSAFAAIATLAVAPALMGQTAGPGDNGPSVWLNQCFPDKVDARLDCFQWSSAPTAQDILAIFPAKALAAKEQGLVTLRCVFGDDAPWLLAQTVRH